MQTADRMVTEILRELAFPLDDRWARPLAFGGALSPCLRDPHSVIQSEAKDRSQNPACCTGDRAAGWERQLAFSSPLRLAFGNPPPPWGEAKSGGPAGPAATARLEAPARTEAPPTGELAGDHREPD